MEYWCHICKREAEITAEVMCMQCHKDFVEEVEQEEFHPRTFAPYYVNSRAQSFPDLIIMPSIRSARNLSSNQDTDPALDAIIHQIMMTDQNRYGPPPASKASVSTLKEIAITNSIIQSRGTLHNGIDEFGQKIACEKIMIECSVCKDEFLDGENAIDMPCMHIFHKQCIVAWLEKHNNCPTCRFELPTDDPEYEARKLQ